MHEEKQEHLLIYEVSPYSYPSSHMDYVCIYNPSSTMVNLSNYYITDFEGYLKLAGNLAPHDKLYVAENRTSFINYFGFSPQLTYSDAKYNGSFSLANHGDEVALIRGTKIVDMVIYGNSKYSGLDWHGPSVSVHAGHILRRLNFVDTNTARDWSDYHRIAQSDFSQYSETAHIEILTYPDDINELYRFISQTKNELDIEMYTLTSYRIFKSLLSLLERNVSINILLEGSPVGGIKKNELAIADALQEHGANVLFMSGSHARYAYVHSKFIIKDKSAVLISTENLDESSISPCGNRGYGIIVKSKSFAEQIMKVFKDDTKHVQDIHPYFRGLIHYSLKNSEKYEVRHREFSPINITAKISTVLAPDYSMMAFKNFVSSQRWIDVEALYLKDYPLTITYPKARRILVQHSINGYEMHTFYGKNEHIEMLHAKLMIGNSKVLVGSMNFGNYSMLYNRELSVIIQNEKAVKYFERVFEADWHMQRKPMIIMRVNINSKLNVDLKDSLGHIREYWIYLDGKMLYHGKVPRASFSLPSPGIHVLVGKVVDISGLADEEKVVIHVSTQFSLDFRIMIFTLIFALFFYKLWKDHGR